MTPDGHTLTLPKWYDLHAHVRQGEMSGPLLRDHMKMGCAGLVAMPNTSPPVGKVFKNDPLPYWSIQEYLEMLNNVGGAGFSDIIVPLYLTKDTSAEMIAQGVEKGVLHTAKYYPPHGTTGAEFGAPFTSFMENGVFAAMEEHGVVLNIHGEEHGLAGEAYFDRRMNAEIHFYTQRLPAVMDQFPKLKIVGEHLTTKTAVEFISGAPDTLVGTITPQHLIYTVGHLLQGFKYHLYCLPLIKFEEDRAALRTAVIDPGNRKFFAGTDSAPHTTKATDCGCAAGCYTGGIAPQLYAQAFELAGVDLSTQSGAAAFKQFLCLNGPAFYGLEVPDETFTLEKTAQEVEALKIGNEKIVPLPMGMGQDTMPWRIVS
jgi:dihydroorotase